MPIDGVEDFHRATSDLDQGDHVALLIQRGANTFFVGLETAA